MGRRGYDRQLAKTLPGPRRDPRSACQNAIATRPDVNLLRRMHHPRRIRGHHAAPRASRHQSTKPIGGPPTMAETTNRDLVTGVRTSPLEHVAPTLRIRSISATEVPPNFMTNRAHCGTRISLASCQGPNACPASGEGPGRGKNGRVIHNDELAAPANSPHPDPGTRLDPPGVLAPPRIA